MSKHILAFGASSSINSINKKLATLAVNQLENCTSTVIDLNDFEMPIYSIDKENENGIHPLAIEFKAQLDKADAFIISFAEHNGNLTAAYKNIYDWCSRIDGDLWQNKPMFLLATSPGGRGAKEALNIALKAYSHSNSNTITSFSLPKFNDNFTVDKGIIDSELKKAFYIQLNLFKKAL